MSLFVIFLVAVCAAGATGFMFPPGEWYRNLRKPEWVPPEWVFPLVWGLLYLLMAWAAARVALTADAGRPLALFSAQIALNTLWTPLFFGRHRMFVSLIVACILWVMVLFMVFSFWAHSLLAGLLVVPYLAWVTAAVAMNYMLMRMNPEAEAKD